MKKIIIALIAITCYGCTNTEKQTEKKKSAPSFDILQLTKEDARNLADSSIANIEKEFPYRLGSLGTAADLLSPKAARPAFYGSGDWSTAVNTTTGLIRLLKIYPDIDSTRVIRKWLLQRISSKNIDGEIAYLQNPFNRNSQRGAGWDNLLKLSIEVKQWNDPIAKELLKNLSPLVQLIESRYLDFLPKLVYPIKGSTANNLSNLWHYANVFGSDSLKHMVAQKAKEFFLKDADYELSKESSKSAKLSSGLEEIKIMYLTLPSNEFKDWLSKFCPEITEQSFTMVPATKTTDPLTEEQKSEELNSPKQLGQAELLNLSRAQRLIELSNELEDHEHLKALGYEHVITALPKIICEQDLKLKLFHLLL